MAKQPELILEEQKNRQFLPATVVKIIHYQVQTEKTEVWKKGLFQQLFC